MTRFLIAAALAVCVSGYAQTKKAPKPAVLFTVGKEKTDAEEFIYLYKKNHPSKEDYTNEKIEEYLSLFVNFKLKVAEARSRGIDKTPEFEKEYNSYKDELRKPYMPEGKILDSLVKVAYERLQRDVSASHILIDVKSEASPEDTVQAYNTALTIKKQLLEGEDFGEKAILYSEDPSAKFNKGFLGYFTVFQMVFPIEDAAYAGKAGDIVGPIRTRFGYHLLKVGETRPSRGEAEVSHIMLRAGQRDEAKTKNLIFEIYDQLRGGAKWDEVVKKYSEDPGSKDTGGRLRPFGVGALNNLPQFDEVAFSLKEPGEISDPFQTAYGWHIVRLEQKIPLPSFEESVVSLKNQLARDERVQLSKAVLMNKLKKDFVFIENAPVKTNVMALADTALAKAKWKIPASFASGKETLFTLQSKKTTAHDFLNYVQQNQRANSMEPDKYMELLYTTFTETAISTAFETKLISANPEFEMLLEEYYEGILLFDIMEKEVWKKASDDSVEQQAYYLAHADKYQAKDRIAASIYYTGSEESSDLVIAAFKKGDSLEINKVVQKEVVHAEAGLFQRIDRFFLADMKWESGIHKVKHANSFYVVEVGQVVPPGAMSFKEARATVIADYQNQLEEQWLVVLRKKFTVKVNDKTKKYVVEKLKS